MQHIQDSRSTDRQINLFSSEIFPGHGFLSTDYAEYADFTDFQQTGLDLLKTKFSGTRNLSRKGEIWKTPQLNIPALGGIQRGRRKISLSILKDFLYADSADSTDY
jgi:hypothetical protein